MDKLGPQASGSGGVGHKGSCVGGDPGRTELCCTCRGLDPPGSGVRGGGPRAGEAPAESLDGEWVAAGFDVRLQGGRCGAGTGVDMQSDGGSEHLGGWARGEHGPWFWPCAEWSLVPGLPGWLPAFLRGTSCSSQRSGWDHTQSVDS